MEMNDYYVSIGVTKEVKCKSEAEAEKIFADMVKEINLKYDLGLEIEVYDKTGFDKAFKAIWEAE